MKTCCDYSACSDRPIGSVAGRFIMVLGLLHGIFACAGPTAVKKDFASYRDAQIGRADVMPSETDLRGHAKRVVVAESETSPVIGQNPGLAQMLTGELEMQVEAAGARIIRRDEVGSLLQEVRRYEQEGALSGKMGLGTAGQAADYALLSRLESVEVSGTFVEAAVDESGRRTGGPWCNYNITLRGSARFYDLSSLRALSTIPMAGSKTMRFVTAGRLCNGSEVPASAALDAAKDAARRARADLRNPLAPKGYIVAARTNGERRIFRVMLARAQDLGPDARLHVYTLRSSTNQLTGAREDEELLLSEARFTDQLGADFAWVTVEDADQASLIRIGDYVRVSYELSVWERTTGIDPNNLLPGVGAR